MASEDIARTITIDARSGREYDPDLLRAAVEAARDRAETLVDAAGAKLGAVAAISHRFRNATYGYVEDADCLMVAEASFSAADGASAAPAFSPEKIRVECEVSVSWAIEAA